MLTINNPEEETERHTIDVTATSKSDFEDLFLKDELLQGILEKGYEFPSPIQHSLIPLALKKKNIIARAKNGTGKTASYLIPILNEIKPLTIETQALILVPTRELALQCEHLIRQLAKYIDLTICSVIGGSSIKDDITRLCKGAHVVIGTPGRVVDLITKAIIDLSFLRTIVLDEVDKLLSQDFKILIQNTMNLISRDTQVLMLSATFPQTIKPFLDQFVPNHVEINMCHELVLIGITQYYAYLKEDQKFLCLLSLLKRLQINQAIVFCNSNRRVEFLAKMLKKVHVDCRYIHSKINQNDRIRILERFISGDVRYLVCSDLLSRGIDVANVNVIINFDMPKNSHTYLHRIGRSGRFGTYAIAINFIKDNDKHYMFTIESQLKTEIQALPKAIDEKLYVTSFQTD